MENNVFKCNDCNKTFKTMYALSYHLDYSRIHNERPRKVKVNHKKYNRNSELKPDDIDKAKIIINDTFNLKDDEFLIWKDRDGRAWELRPNFKHPKLIKT